MRDILERPQGRRIGHGFALRAAKMGLCRDTRDVTLRGEREEIRRGGLSFERGLEKEERGLESVSEGWQGEAGAGVKEVMLL
jgi:hypothetical protein